MEQLFLYTSVTISRVMSWMIIYLVLLLPAASSDLPENRSGKSIVLFLVLLRMGFTCALRVTEEAVVSYTTFPPLPHKRRFISVALALESPPPDVIRHPALRSPDFPNPHICGAAIICHTCINFNIISSFSFFRKSFLLFAQNQSSPWLLFTRISFQLHNKIVMLNSL